MASCQTLDGQTSAANVHTCCMGAVTAVLVMALRRYPLRNTIPRKTLPGIGGRLTMLLKTCNPQKDDDCTLESPRQSLMHRSYMFAP